VRREDTVMMSLGASVTLAAAALCLQGCTGGGPPGGGGADSCASDGTDYTYTESVSGTDRTITTNHCPNHPWVSLNPNTPIAEELSYTIPANPQFSGEATAWSQASAIKDLSAEGAGVGVFFSGAFLFSPYGGPMYGVTEDFESSAPYVEGNSFDQCGCHSSQTSSASYHCHQPPVCLMRQLGQTDAAHAPQIGWAYDGFPIYGSRGPAGTLMKQCALQGLTYGVDVCTDACGGYYNSDDSIDNFVYRYYMQGPAPDGTSCDTPACPAPTEEYHPTSPLCFRGCCPSGMNCEKSIEACGASGTYSNGYTNSYSAAAAHPVGLAVNTGGCAADDLVCTTSCTEQGWSEEPRC